LTYAEYVDFVKKQSPSAFVQVLGSQSSKESQAKNLFRLLRDLGKEGYSEIFAPLPKKTGIGLALYNRMIRAAAHSIIRL
jgi:L-threonylcarbamoyladenylate synthase